MGKLPYFPFYVGDWLRDPGQRMLTLEEKGAWVELLVAMHDGDPRGEITGTIAGLSRLLGVDEEDGYYILHGLIEKKVCNVVFPDGTGDYFYSRYGEEHKPMRHDTPFCPVSVTLISRRMKREENEKEKEREKKRRQRESRERPEDVPEVSPECPSVYSYSSSVSSSVTNKDIMSEIPSDAPRYPADSIPYALADFLQSQIRENNPTAKLPELLSATGQKWCDVFRLMIERDDREPDLIAGMVQWCQQDDFWCGNILSPGKLREKWDTLVMQATRNGKPLPRLEVEE